MSDRENYGSREGGHRQASPMELLSSVKALGEAAQLVSGRQTEKVDKGKVASAAEDVLEAAKRYGKLDDKGGMGQYVQKAETYLHGYHSAGGDHKSAGGQEGGGGGSGGYGDYLKMAGGLLNKSGDGGNKSEEKESGYGDYLKKAQGFLK